MILIGITTSLNELVKASSLNPSSLGLTNLRYEYLIDPIGIGEVNPRLSCDTENGAPVYLVGSGAYQFHSTLPENIIR